MSFLYLLELAFNKVMQKCNFKTFFKIGFLFATKTLFKNEKKN